MTEKFGMLFFGCFYLAFFYDGWYEEMEFPTRENDFNNKIVLIYHLKFFDQIDDIQ